MRVSGGARWFLRVGTAFTMAFLYAPLIVIGIYAFNETRVQQWPPPGLTLSWFDKAFTTTGSATRCSRASRSGSRRRRSR